MRKFGIMASFSAVFCSRRRTEASAFDHRQSAWRKLISHKPVAVLCDTETPGINAGELTRRMRAEPNLQDIPVILLRKPFDSLEAADVTDMVRSGLESQARPRDPSAG